eukprot:s2549_g1.t1
MHSSLTRSILTFNSQHVTTKRAFPEGFEDNALFPDSEDEYIAVEFCFKPTPPTSQNFCAFDESERKGFLYHATLENFSADLVIESEMLDAEKAATFRSRTWSCVASGYGQTRHSVCGRISFSGTMHGLVSKLFLH